MISSKEQRVLIKKLKKQIQRLQRKEEKGRHQLEAAFQKIRKVSRIYKNKLAIKVQFIKNKLAQMRASTYMGVAKNLEQQLLKNIEGKAKTLTSIIARLEKKHMAKLAKEIIKKGRKVKKTKKISPSKMKK